MIGSGWRRAVSLGIDSALDWVYPPRCLICEQGGSPAICETCAASFTPIPEPLCDRCGRPTDDTAGSDGGCRLCERAAQLWGDWSFERARAAAIFSGPMRHAIHGLKYAGKEALAEPLGAFLSDRMTQLSSGDFDAILPMPGAKSRERTRGYNPPRLLCETLSDTLRAPILPRAAAVRVGRAREQVRLSPEARRKNVDAANFVVDAPSVANRSILIVDDVFTTGASVNALASALKSAGARRVEIVTLAAGG